MKIYEYDLVSLCNSVYARNEILSVKTIEKCKSIWAEYYRIIFQDDSWINLVGEVSICYDGLNVGQVCYYSLYPLNERMIKKLRKAVKVAIG